MNATELREAAEAVGFWLDPANNQARKELEQRNPPLGEGLSMVEKKVQEKLAEQEAQEEGAKIKA
jgi:hypothetical protein